MLIWHGKPTYADFDREEESDGNCIEGITWALALEGAGVLALFLVALVIRAVGSN